MRKLFYVPVIHTEADLGSIAPCLAIRGTASCGEDRWNKHRETVARFWEHLASYFQSFDVDNVKVYQDALPADGDLAIKIIEEGARAGSRNHQIILDLTKRGATIMKTEDPALLKEEYKRTVQLSRSNTAFSQVVAYVRYRLGKGRLTKARDKFIARTINETLKDGEIGVFFMGSDHDVLAYLADDIAVERLKDRERINAYLKELSSGQDEATFQQLARYVASTG
jgi:hypothetical protein